MAKQRNDLIHKYSSEETMGAVRPPSNLNQHQQESYEIQFVAINKTMKESRTVASYPYELSQNNPQKAASDGQWMALQCEEKGFQLYAYSAFYDDREFTASSGPAVVRVMGTSEYPSRTDVTLMCLLWYNGEVAPEVSVAIDTEITYDGKHEGKWFQQFIYVCPIKREEAIPKHVSIVCSSSIEPQFHLPVEVAERPAVVQDFGICVCASYSHRDPFQLVEWMEMQKILGVSKVTMYNHSISENTSRIFKHYVDEGFVEYRQTYPFWEETGTGFARVKPHKAPTINDCMYRNMYRFKKILVIDFDEFIIPRQHHNLSEMLTAIDKIYPLIPSP